MTVFLVWYTLTFHNTKCLSFLEVQTSENTHVIIKWPSSKNDCDHCGAESGQMNRQLIASITRGAGLTLCQL